MPITVDNAATRHPTSEEVRGPFSFSQILGKACTSVDEFGNQSHSLSRRTYSHVSGHRGASLPSTTSQGWLVSSDSSVARPSIDYHTLFTPNHGVVSTASQRFSHGGCGSLLKSRIFVWIESFSHLSSECISPLLWGHTQLELTYERFIDYFTTSRFEVRCQRMNFERIFSVDVCTETGYGKWEPNLPNWIAYSLLWEPFFWPIFSV